VGWDRKHAGPEGGYFYESVRTPAGVRKVYRGRGAAGHEAAAEVEQRRHQRHQAKAAVQAERDAVAEADRLADELQEVSTALLTAWLVANGFRCHKGCWRKARA
jgi:hypothetical protein